MEHRSVLLFLLQCLSISLQVSSGLNLTSHYTHQHIYIKDTATILFTADEVPITSCQFFLRRYADNNSYRDLALIDFSNGTTSESVIVHDDVHLKKEMYTLKYEGDGLNEGDCGLRLTGLADYCRYVVGCRVRTDQSAWTYDFTTIDVYYPYDAELVITPNQRIVVANPGDNVTLYCTVASFTTNWIDFIFPPGGDVYRANTYSGNTYGYSFTVREEHSGVIWCRIRGYKNAGIEYGGIAMIVTKGWTSKLVSNKEAYEVGDNLTASCEVSFNGLTPPVIEWRKNNERVNDGVIETTLDNTWKWPWERQFVIQNFKTGLIVHDNGAVISCHVLNHILDSSITLRVDRSSNQSSTPEIDKTTMQNATFTPDTSPPNNEGMITEDSDHGDCMNSLFHNNSSVFK